MKFQSIWDFNCDPELLIHSGYKAILPAVGGLDVNGCPTDTFDVSTTLKEDTSLEDALYKLEKRAIRKLKKVDATFRVYFIENLYIDDIAKTVTFCLGT